MLSDDGNILTLWLGGMKGVAYCSIKGFSQL